MITEEYLKDNFINAYFIDDERKNIEILTTSEDKKSVIPTIILLKQITLILYRYQNFAI